MLMNLVFFSQREEYTLSLEEKQDILVLLQRENGECENAYD